MVLAAEVGGRWSDEAACFVRALAGAKAQSEPLSMRGEERHADLRDALLQGDSNRALDLTAKLSDGVEQMVEMTDGMRP